MVALLYSTAVIANEAANDIDFSLPDDLDILLDESVRSKHAWGGYLKNETAYRFDEPRSFTKIRNIASLNWSYSLTPQIRFYTSARAYYDHVYDLFNFDTIAARSVRDEDEPLVFLEQLEKQKDDERKEFKEFYFDIFFDNLDLRIGKQYVIWGVLEGMRIVDEINPMDFRELITPELLDYRIALSTFRANYYAGTTTYELIWIPELVFHRSAPRGSEWELFQTLDGTTQPKSYQPEFSEIGFKITHDLLDAEISFSYFYTWDDYPTTFRVISIADVTSATPTEALPIFPTYTRMQIFGMTFTKEISGDIFKAEFAYVKDKYFAVVDKYVDNFLISDGDVQRDHIRWGLGYDFNLMGADVSPAIGQAAILDYQNYILTTEFDTTLNVFVRKPLPKYSAVFSLLYIHILKFQESYIKPRINFDLNSHFRVTLGGDFFIGQRTKFGRKADGLAEGGLVTPQQRARFLGNFNENKRFILEFKYTF